MQSELMTYGFVSSGETISAAPGVFGVCLVDVLPPPQPEVNTENKQISTSIDTALYRRIITSPERQEEVTFESRTATYPRLRNCIKESL